MGSQLPGYGAADHAVCGAARNQRTQTTCFSTVWLPLSGPMPAIRRCGIARGRPGVRRLGLQQAFYCIALYTRMGFATREEFVRDFWRRTCSPETETPMTSGHDPLRGKAVTSARHWVSMAILSRTQVDLAKTIVLALN